MERTYNIRFHGIEIIEKALYKTKVTDTQTFRFNIKVQSTVDSNKKLLITLVAIEIAKDNDEELVGKMTVACGYDIDEFDRAFPEIEKSNIPSELESLLRSVSISTARGIMFSEFRGTHLNKAVLPIILPNQMVPSEENINQ